MPKKPKNYYTALEIADMFGVTRRTVYAWFASGDLETTHVGPVLRYVSPDQLARFISISDREVVVPPSRLEDESSRVPAKSSSRSAPSSAGRNLQRLTSQPSLPSEYLPEGSGLLAPLPSKPKSNASSKAKRRR